MAWYWHRVVELLERAGREVIAVDLPGDDENSDLDDYADIVARAAEIRANLILVAQLPGSPLRWSASGQRSVCSCS